MQYGIGEIFHRETKYAPGSVPEGKVSLPEPESYKRYDGAPRVPLDEPRCEPEPSLCVLLRARRSIRHFADEPILKRHLSYLLWASSGISCRQGGVELRTAPSAGALYPIETYLFAHNVESIPSGIYHYSVQDHQLEELKRGDFRGVLEKAGLGQPACAQAGVVFAWAGLFGRTTWKYGQRGFRYVYLDAGHIAQNCGLAAASSGLGCCEIGAFYDDEMNGLIGLDGDDESVISISVVGQPSITRAVVP